MLIVKPPYFITRLMPRMTWGFYGELQKVFLTFDDGPTPEVSDWVLAQLKKYNAKATFFCIGRNVEHYPDIYQRTYSPWISHQGYNDYRSQGCLLIQHSQGIDCNF